MLRSKIDGDMEDDVQATMVGFHGRGSLILSWFNVIWAIMGEIRDN